MWKARPDYFLKRGRGLHRPGLCLLLVFFFEYSATIACASELGSRLFFDPRLSGDSKTMCATCHQPGKLWGDGTATPNRFPAVKRNSQSTINLSIYPQFFWDGRAGSLVEQALIPLHAPDEMGSNAEKIAALITADSHLLELYIAGYGCQGLLAPGSTTACQADRLNRSNAADPRQVTVNVAMALAEFQLRINSEPQPSRVYAEGRGVFEAQGCADCHAGPYLSNGEVVSASPHVVEPINSQQRRQAQALVTQIRAQFSAYYPRPLPFDGGDNTGIRVPSLWNVPLTGPYFHDGSAENLRQVLLRTKNLQEDHRQILLDYLQGLADPRLQDSARNGYLLLETM